MASEEEHVIRQFLSLNYECLNYFDFSLADNKKEDHTEDALLYGKIFTKLPLV